MGSKPLAVPFSVLLLIAFVVPALLAGGSGVRDRDDVTDGAGGVYHLRFVTLKPNALFLPVLLRSDMVLYVHTGRGRLNWADENDVRRIDLRRGDIYKLRPGTIFYVQSSLEPEREKLRINAIFTNTEEDIYEPSIGAYSSIGDLLRGFDSKVLQGAFKVPEEVVKEVISATRPPPIVHAAASEKRTKYWDWEARFLKTYLSSTGYLAEGSSSNKKTKTFNVFDADCDFENCNGWSLMVTGKDMHALKLLNIEVFMVNLTKAIVLQGQGMIRVVCSSTAKESECNNTRFKVSEGDVLVVPRFHPMAQMSFNNESLVFMGFSTSTKRNYPQFLAGKSSILRALDREILAAAFNVTSTTIHHILAPQTDSIILHIFNILDCTSCAEEEERIMEEEIEKERREEEEEAKRREEEERERERQEEEEREREREEEEEREREEEEERERERQEEKERRRQEEEERERERGKEERERKRQEEEQRRREEEEQ
ncbi:hypothetical protein ACJRO7_020953 [Eucalyptus globulus]|uniref:Cupin type-1 domain-containing protein n=1 Tax=Eucalyptus globulus TaxID=34317 RepID=A0ABD3KUX2_EUCGL